MVFSIFKGKNNLLYQYSMHNSYSIVDANQFQLSSLLCTFLEEKKLLDVVQELQQTSNFEMMPSGNRQTRVTNIKRLRIHHLK